MTRTSASVPAAALLVIPDGSGPGLGPGELLHHARQPDVLAGQHGGGHERGKQSVASVSRCDAAKAPFTVPGVCAFTHQSLE